IARELAAQTMLGAAKMVLETTEHPARLKNMVTTPGGTTAAGLFALEEGALRSVLMKAVAEATRRSCEMSG
ncbi:MAG: pyrroline-5-carboxylate reductase dimerization domain-containing protein, partial [Desulfotomaculaceae bacterium]|nr:pyrroline-5-carboxylate reductase dimerization domain-containing protein [Desulfotomaculaceae bacterium]